MTIERQVFNILTDTGGDFVDTGPPCHGMVLQVRYQPYVNGAGADTGMMDTGAGIKLELINSGVVVAHYEKIGETAWTRIPRQHAYDTGGDVMGNQYTVAAHDRLRLTVTDTGNGATGKSAKLFVWTGW